MSHPLCWPVLVTVLTTGAIAAQSSAVLVTELGDTTDYQRRNAAYQILRRTNPPDALALLIKALPQYGLASQSLGMSLIGSYPIARSNDTFRSLLSSNSPYLSLSAAASLYRRGEQQQLPRMLAALRADHRPGELSMMLNRVNYIKAEPLQAEVRKLVRADAELAVLKPALYHLLLAKNQAAREVARSVLASNRAPTQHRSVCAAFLVSMGDADAATVLNKALLAPEPSKLSDLYQFLNRAQALSASTLNAILSIIESTHDKFQTTLGLRILATHKHRPALPLIRKLLNDEDQQIAKAAYDALASLAGSLDAKELHELLDSSRPDLVLVAADLLRRMDDLNSLPRVITLLGQPSKHQAQAAKVLGGFRLPASVDPLLNALEHDDPAVRTNAFNSLAAVFRSLFPYRRIDLGSTGYTAGAGQAERTEGLAKLRAFWTQHRIEK